MKKFIIELTFLDEYGVHRYRYITVEAESISAAGSTVSEMIECYEDENDWDFVSSRISSIVS